jgi:hypothetical protein
MCVIVILKYGMHYRDLETMLNSKIAEVYGANDVINSTDLKKHIVNIDSRFRNSSTESPSNFLYRFAHPYKNIIRMRVASVEIPQPWNTFTYAKKNIGFVVKAYDVSDAMQNMLVAIPPGNYTYSELEIAIQEQFNLLAATYGIFMKITINSVSKKCKIENLGVSPIGSLVPTIEPSPFTLDFSVVGFEKRNADWGLGYNLGFRKRVIYVDYANVATSFDVYVVSSCPVDIVGDVYSLLAINDYYTVEHRTDDNYIQAMAKIIGTRSGSGSILFDSGYTTLTNDFVFPSPTDLKQVQIQLLDPYGIPLEMDCSNFSISFEITEVTNLKMYEFYRNYLWLGAIPRVSPKAAGSAVAGYLPLPAGW